MSVPRARFQVPAAAAALIRRLLPPGFRRDVLGDLEENYHTTRRSRGGWRARVWYWRQAFDFILKLPAAGFSGGLPKDPHRGHNMIATILADLRYALRGLMAEPLFTLVVVGTLALAVGANTAIFSVVDGLLLSPLDYPQPDRLVRLYQYYADSRDTGEPRSYDVVSPVDYLDYRDRDQIFEALVGMGNYSPTGFDLTGDGQPQRIASLPVTADYFDVFGTRPIMGRGFERDEETAESRVVLLSAALWRDAYDADPEIVGETIQLDGEGWEVIGVMPWSFVDLVGGRVDVWVPQNMTLGGRNKRGNHYMTVVGRLAPDVTLATAQQRLDVYAEELARLYPRSNAERYAVILPLHEDSLGNADTMLWVLLASTGLVLLIGCVNVANLLIGRGIRRRKEFAVRAALGSGRLRLVSQLLTESLLLALIGGTVGAGLAMVLTRALLRAAPESLTIINDVTFNLRVLGFSLALSLLTAAIFGVVPAFRSVGTRIETTLREGDRGNTGARGAQRMRGALVVSEVALALVLLVAAGLMMRSFWLLQTRDIGIEPANVMTFELRLPSARYATGEVREAFYQELHARLATLPGVVSAGAVQWLPATGPFNTWGFGIADPEADGGWNYQHRPANIRTIAGDYLATVGIPLVAGRSWGSEHAFDTPFTGYINEAAAADGWGEDASPLGEVIRVGGHELEIIGIVGDTLLSQRSIAVPKIYFSHTQFSTDRRWSMFQLVRTDGDVVGLMTTIRALIVQIDPELVAYNVRSLEQAIGTGIASTWFAMMLLVGFTNGRFEIEGNIYQQDRDYPSARIVTVDENYFDTLATPMLAGRNFTSADAADSQPVMIVDQNFADLYFDGDSPIGKQIAIRGISGTGVSERNDELFYTIVGMAPSLYLTSQFIGLAAEAIYVPIQQRPTTGLTLLARVAGDDPLVITRALKDVLAGVDPDLPLSVTQSMDDALATANSFLNIFAVLFVSFGAAALFLATIGLYGVLSFSVSQRSHEVGLRVALGASPRDVWRLILGQGFKQLAAGLAVGLLLALALGRGISVMLYQVSPSDPVVIGGILVILMAAGMTACYFPARRATRVDPLEAMRAE